jgi:hypothetical protein
MLGSKEIGTLIQALGTLGTEVWTVLAALPAEPVLLEAGILPAPSTDLDARWRERIGPVLRSAGLPEPPATPEAATPSATGARDDGQKPATARTGHSEAFRWLHGEFTAVRRLDPSATW